jgi:hypothetical protein
MFSVSDWALKRVLKFVLKKSVGRFLHSEPDLEQLDVQLSTGTFELRNVLLNCDAVNEQLVSCAAGFFVGGGLAQRCAGAHSSSISSNLPVCPMTACTRQPPPTNLCVPPRVCVCAPSLLRDDAGR